MFSIEVRGGDDFDRFMNRLFQDQIPFATSKAINATAVEFQQTQRRGMRDRFTIRRPWVLQGVKISRGDFARKDRLQARIHIDQKREFLVIHEPGGIKEPRGALFAVPDAARRTKAGVVSKTIRPRALSFERWGRGRVATVYRGDKRTFMVVPHGRLRGGIYQRRGKGKRGRVRQLFSFTPAARIEPRLEFEETAVRVVGSTFKAIYAREFERAIQSAR